MRINFCPPFWGNKNYQKDIIIDGRGDGIFDILEIFC